MVLLSLVSFNQTDPSLNHAVSNASVVKNNAGLFGAYLSGLLVDIFGLSAFVWPLIFIAWGAGCVSTWFTMPWWRWFGFALLAACLLSLGAAWDIGVGDVRGGGMLGMALYKEFTSFFNPIGATLIWLFLLFISLELAFGIEWLTLLHKGWQLVRPLFGEHLKELEATAEKLRSRLSSKGQTDTDEVKEEKTTTESVEVIPLFELHEDAPRSSSEPPLTFDFSENAPERRESQTESDKKKRAFNLSALLSLTSPEKKASKESRPASTLELNFDFDAPQEQPVEATFAQPGSASDEPILDMKPLDM